MRTRRSHRNQDRLYREIGRDLAAAAAAALRESAAAGVDPVCPDGPACPSPDCRALRRALGLPVSGPDGDRLTLFDQIVHEGIPHDSHYSDLYLPVTPRTRQLLHDHGLQASTFVSQTDPVGSLWYDIPFRYLPYWRQRQNHE